MYENIGGDAPLAFAVIGPAVNLTARIASLCKELQIDCDGGHHRFEQCDLAVGEAVVPGRREGKGLIGSVAERHRQTM